MNEPVPIEEEFPEVHARIYNAITRLLRAQMAVMETYYNIEFQPYRRRMSQGDIDSALLELETAKYWVNQSQEELERIRPRAALGIDIGIPLSRDATSQSTFRMEVGV